MRRNKKLLGVFLIIIALIIMQLPKSEADAATSASDFEIEGTVLVKYTGTSQNVKVPDTVDTIGEAAFEDNLKIQKVTLPSSVKRIEAYAFWGCDNLETVSLGKGLTSVDDYAFANCKGLKTMTIPGNVRSIGIGAFTDCVNLTDITIPVEVTSIHETAFDGCAHVVIHCQTGSYAEKYAQSFYERQKEMPEYEDVAKYQPDSVETVTPTPEPDSGNADGQVTDTTGNVIGSTTVVANQAVVFIDSTSPQVVLSGLGADNPSDPESADLENTGNIPMTVTSAYPKYTIVNGRIIADQAYYRSEKLANVSLPSGIEEIGEFAYARSSVSQITIPEGVSHIGYGAFYHCDNLNSVSLPATLTCVEPKAFVHSAWVENFLSGAFGESNFLISGNTLVAYRGNDSQVTIPEGVALIAGEAFQNHDEIEGLTLPQSLKVIGEGAFENCGKLSSVEFGENIEDIKDRAFAGCSLEAVTLPASLKTLGIGAFDGETMVTYSGAEPEKTHELSAERLSNEAYRNPPEDGSPAGVTVLGYSGISARLEGATKNYVLTVLDDFDASKLKEAFLSSMGTEFPQDGLILELILTDNSDINITKLGKQQLIVMIPLPESYAESNVNVVTCDRNGQLESVRTQRVSADGKDYVQITTSHLSPFGIYADGTVLDSASVVEDTTFLTSMAQPTEEGEAEGQSFFAGIRYQWILGGGLLILGILCIFRRTKYI